MGAYEEGSMRKELSPDCGEYICHAEVVADIRIISRTRFICVQAQTSGRQAGHFDESRCGGFIVAGEEFRALVKRRLAGDCEERMTLRLR